MAAFTDGDVAAAIDALGQAAHKLQFLQMAAELEELEHLDPEGFLVEILGDIRAAAVRVGRVRHSFVSKTL